MSRCRFQEDTQDALELFLDAISNVFGGIVFIALAVVILLQFSTANPSDAIGDVTQRQQAPADSDDLRRQIAVLRALLEDAEQNDRVDTGRYQAALAEVELAEAELARLHRVQEEQQQDVLEARAAIDAAEQHVAALEQQLLDARTALENAPRMSPDRQRVGRFQTTAKREVPVMLKAEHLVEVLRFPSGGGDPTVNADDLRLDTTANRVRPRPGAGTRIGDGAAGDQALIGWLAGLDPRRDYLSVAVWPDAFGPALRLRDHALDMGFAFTLTPVADDRGVPFKATSGVQ